MLEKIIEVPDPLRAVQEKTPGWSWLSVVGIVWPERRPLWEFIQPVDIQALYELAEKELFPLEALVGRHRIDFSDPLEVRNWVARFTRYVPDLEQYGVMQHWPDPGQVLDSGGDDCDGLGILTNSTLWSFGRPGVRLTLGHAGTDTPDYKNNHMWCTWFPPNGGPPRVLETTGDDEVGRLPTYEELAEYNYIPRVMAERKFMSEWADPAVPEGRTFLCGHYADKYEEVVVQDIEKAEG